MKRLLKSQFYMHYKYGNTKNSLLYFSLILLVLIPIGLNIPISKKDNLGLILNSHSNEITLKISGTSDQFIVNENFSPCPIALYLNNVQKDLDTANCRKFNIPDGSTPNTIQIVFDISITSFEGMFADLTNLVEVDLSKFDSSSINLMRSMFSGCSSLTSIDLTNLKTNLVYDMQSMFTGCSSLKELDLSSFDTSKVINMDFMFKDCTQLRSLNISSFVTSNVERMQAMFQN